MNGAGKGGQWAYYAVHTRCARRDSQGLNRGHHNIGFRLNGVYRGSAYQTRSDWIRSDYRRGGVASLGYAMAYIGFRWWCEWCNEGMRF